MSVPEAVLLMVSAGGRDEAEHLGERVVEEGLAACGSVVPAVHSFYFWGGQMQRAHEALLILKTTREKSAKAVERILELHSYENPEVLELPVTGGSSTYLEWLAADPGRGALT